MILDVDVTVKYAGINFDVYVDYNTKNHATQVNSVKLAGNNITDIITKDAFARISELAHTGAKQTLIDEGYLNASDF